MLIWNMECSSFQIPIIIKKVRYLRLKTFISKISNIKQSKIIKMTNICIILNCKMKKISKWMKKKILAKLKILKTAQGKMNKISKMVQIESNFKIKTNNFKTFNLIHRQYLKDPLHFWQFLILKSTLWKNKIGLFILALTIEKKS